MEDGTEKYFVAAKDKVEEVEFSVPTDETTVVLYRYQEHKWCVIACKIGDFEY
jgi:gamma-glutamylcyclotransferase (GGCT)/AIG2-like uncharacterized protein YtfP